MISKLILPGSKIDIMQIDVGQSLSGEEVNSKVYASKMLDVADNEKIKIAMPIDNGKIVPFPINSRHELFFYTNTGLYQCTGKVVDRYKDNNIYTLELELLSELKKYQRRQFFRLECALDVKYMLIDNENTEFLMKNPEKIDDSMLKSAIAIDLSGGGLRFITDERIDSGTVAYLRLYVDCMDQESEIGLFCNVLSSVRLKNNFDRFENRAEFINIPKDERELIIKFIFEEERRKRKSEKG